MKKLYYIIYHENDKLIDSNDFDLTNKGRQNENISSELELMLSGTEFRPFLMPTLMPFYKNENPLNSWIYFYVEYLLEIINTKIRRNFIQNLFRNF